MKKTALYLAIIFAFSACKQSEQPMYQFSTIESLMAGNYDGQRHVESLKSFGDFGIGTFNKLDGEMIFYKGEIFKVKSDGTVCQSSSDETTPYASVCWFQPSIIFTIPTISKLSELDSLIKMHLPNSKYIYALEITGLFDSVKYRSVAKQNKPYRPLIEVVNRQVVFHHEKIKGTLLGFYAPTSVKDVMVKGMHLHLLSDDLKYGGHLLNVTSKQKITCRIAIYSGMQLDLHQAKISSQKEQKVQQSDIEKVEK